MGMDGLSMSNTGMLREATSRDFGLQNEEAIHRDDANKQVDQLQTKMRIKEEDHEKDNQQEKNKKRENKKNEDEASVYEETKEQPVENEDKNDFNNLIDKNFENNSFYVKISKDGDLFELYDKESDRLVEKIDAKEVNQLISKLNLASGILVNRSV